MAGIGTGSGGQRRLVGIEDQLDGAIANGMNGNLEARLVRLEHLGFEDLGRHHPEPEVVRLALVRLTQAGRPATQATVAEQLDRAEAEPVVAEPGPHPQADEGVEVLVQHHHQIGADRQLPGQAQALIGPQLDRVVDAGLGHAGDALLQEGAAAPFQGGGDLSFGGSGDRGPDHRQGGLAQDSGQFPPCIAVEDAAIRVRRVAGDAGQGQGAAVGDADMVAHPHQDDRVIGRDRIEVVPGRVPPLGQPGVVVAAALDPLAGRTVADSGGDEVDNLRH